MLFACYWELNENMSAEQRFAIAQKLTSSGLLPKNVEILRFDETPDLWGITLFQAETAADVAYAVNLWRAAGAGFFKTTRTAPVLPVQETMELGARLLKAVR